MRVWVRMCVSLRGPGCSGIRHDTTKRLTIHPVPVAVTGVVTSAVVAAVIVIHTAVALTVAVAVALVAVVAVTAVAVSIVVVVVCVQAHDEFDSGVQAGGVVGRLSLVVHVAVRGQEVLGDRGVRGRGVRGLLGVWVERTGGRGRGSR